MVNLILLPINNTSHLVHHDSYINNLRLHKSTYHNNLMILLLLEVFDPLLIHPEFIKLLGQGHFGNHHVFQMFSLVGPGFGLAEVF